MSQNTDPFPTPRGALSPEGVSARVPQMNGCICQECSERGVECTNVASTGEDQCYECWLGRHRVSAPEPLGVPGYAGAKGAVPEATLVDRLAEHTPNAPNWSGNAHCDVCHGIWPCDASRAGAALRAAQERERVLMDYIAAERRRVEAEARAAAPPDIDAMSRALHATALLNHNIGEGLMRAICTDPGAHEDRAAAILAFLASPDATLQIDHRAMAQGVSEGTDQPIRWPGAARREPTRDLSRTPEDMDR